MSFDLSTLLICLVANEHLLVRGDARHFDNFVNAIVQVSSQSGLTCQTLRFTKATTLQEFSEAILTDDGCVPNVIVVKDLEQGSQIIQLQALELIRSRRIYSRTALHTTPKHFLMVALISSSSPGPPYLTLHLNDNLFMCQRLQPIDETESLLTSIFLPTTGNFGSLECKPTTFSPNISPEVITAIQNRVRHVYSTAEVRRHSHNIVTFMRLHRAVEGGVSALANRHLTVLAKILPALEGIAYTTPTHLAQATRLAFPHRVELATSTTERSMQWGSDSEAVEWALHDKTSEAVVEEVLQEIHCPL